MRCIHNKLRVPFPKRAQKLAHEIHKCLLLLNHEKKCFVKAAYGSSRCCRHSLALSPSNQTTLGKVNEETWRGSKQLQQRNRWVVNSALDYISIRTSKSTTTLELAFRFSFLLFDRPVLLLAVHLPHLSHILARGPCRVYHFSSFSFALDSWSRRHEARFFQFSTSRKCFYRQSAQQLKLADDFRVLQQYKLAWLGLVITICICIVSALLKRWIISV